jgi:hypothetical protein
LTPYRRYCSISPARSARKDLVAEYEAFNQPAKAALMGAQIAMSTGDPKERDE